MDFKRGVVLCRGFILTGKRKRFKHSGHEEGMVCHQGGVFSGVPLYLDAEEKSFIYVFLMGRTN